MTPAYATVAQLLEYLSTEDELVTQDETELARRLTRASDLLDSRAIRTAFTVNPATGLPADPVVAEALMLACCAQVEFWEEVGESSDIDGMAGRQSSVGGLSVTLPDRLAPRALDHVVGAGLATPRTNGQLP